MRPFRLLVSGLLLWTQIPSPAAPPNSAASANPLLRVRHFMYQLQGIEEPAAVEQLARSPYDMLVIEPTFTSKEETSFDAKAAVAKLKAGRAERLVIAYVDIGEAEQFRTYWRADWVVPTKQQRGHPSFLLAPDPDGWEGDVSIAFWDPQWRAIWLGEHGLLTQIMHAGFDGIYMDWVEAYAEKGVVAEAKKQGVNPTKAMVDFIGALRQQVRALNPNGVVIAQNAVGLIDEDPRYVSLIDGLGVEDTWFSGKADAKWNSPKGGDIPNKSRDDDDSTAALLRRYQKYQQAGLPVFTIDYCLKPENAARVYAEAARAGLLPLVTRVSLERLTTTPPPGLR